MAKPGQENHLPPPSPRRREGLPAPARAVLWHVVSLILLASGIFLLSRVLPWGGMPERIGTFFQESGPGGILLYPALLALCNLLLLPGGVLSLASGYLFGLWTGFGLVLGGTVLGAAAAFQITRSWLRGFVERRLLHHPRWMALDRLIERTGWRVVLLSQLNPLFPTSLINYLYGATRMRFWPCMLWVAVGQMPGLLLYVYLGTVGKFGIDVLCGEAKATPLDFGLWLGGLIFGVCATIALGVVAARLWKEAADHLPSDAPPASGDGHPCSPAKDQTAEAAAESPGGQPPLAGGIVRTYASE